MIQCSQQRDSVEQRWPTHGGRGDAGQSEVACQLGRFYPIQRAISSGSNRLNHVNVMLTNDLQKSRSLNPQTTGHRLNSAARARNAVIPSKKPTAENDDGLVTKDSRVFRRRLELFVASVAEWESDVVRMVMAA